MNYLRLSLAAGALTLTITLSAFAGEMQTTVASTGGTSSEVIAVDPVTEIALNLVQGMLSLF